MTQKYLTRSNDRIIEIQNWITISNHRTVGSWKTSKRTRRNPRREFLAFSGIRLSSSRWKVLGVSILNTPPAKKAHDDFHEPRSGSRERTKFAHTHSSRLRNFSYGLDRRSSFPRLPFVHSVGCISFFSDPFLWLTLVFFFWVFHFIKLSFRSQLIDCISDCLVHMHHAIGWSMRITTLFN